MRKQSILLVIYIVRSWRNRVAGHTLINCIFISSNSVKEAKRDRAEKPTYKIITSQINGICKYYYVPGLIKVINEVLALSANIILFVASNGVTVTA